METRVKERGVSLIRGVVLAFLGLMGLSSCAHKEPEPPPPTPEELAKPKPLHEWFGDGVQGAKSVKIDIDQQKAILYRDGKEVGWTTVATGIYSHPTPTGNFKVLEKTVAKKSNLWGKIYNSSGKISVSDAKAGRDSVPEGGRFEGASMPYWMRLTGDGIGMHQGPIPRPGKRASHGCIRVHSGFVKTLFGFVEIGTPVSVVGDGPKWSPPKFKPKPKPVETPAPEGVPESVGEGAVPTVTPEMKIPEPAAVVPSGAGVVEPPPVPPSGGLE
jgi:L,D-transpeptidase catalytic domain